LIHRLPGLRRLLWIGLLWLGFLAPARAIDPRLSWETILTPHFAVHFSEGMEPLASQLAREAEQAFARLTESLAHAPNGRIQMVISDDSDSANGAAQVLPYNVIQVIASPPEEYSELADYDRYGWILVVHELTHIIHMDMVSGLPAALNWVFGRKFFPNGAQPLWFSEGLAVHYESAFSSAGRIRSSLFQMYLRTAALSGSFPRVDQLEGLTKKWPQGASSYLFGGFFMDDIAERFGPDAMAKLSHGMSGKLFPWSLNTIARQELHSDYPSLYAQWRDKVIGESRQLAARLGEQGLTPYRLLTQRGQINQTPRFFPGGERILYYSGPTDRRAALRSMARDGSDDRELVPLNGEGSGVISPDGRFLLYSQPEVVDQYAWFDDLYLWDLESGKRWPLTQGARARSPDISPDGQQVVFVHNQQGKTALSLIRMDGTDLRTCTSFVDDTQVYAPRFSPDGQRVVFSAARPGGGRNLYLLHLSDRLVEPLTTGRYMDQQPVFSPDGQRIYFASDRTGIFNLYALGLESRKLARLTNVTTGVFSPEPAPDGRGVMFMVYGSKGYDLGWADLPLREQPAGEIRAARPAPTPQAPALKGGVTIQDYRAWETLWPETWFPTFGQDPWGSTWGVFLTGSDALGKLSYVTEVSFNPEQAELYLDLGLSARVMAPTVSTYLGRHISRYHNQASYHGSYYPVDKEKRTLFLDVAFPFPRARDSVSFFVNYDLSVFDRLTEVPRDPGDFEPLVSDDTNLAWLSVGMSYASLERYIDSISPEKGLSTSISLRYSHPSIGSGSRIAEARFALRGYLPLVRSWHFVLAMGLQGGVAIGDPRRKSLYSMGGLPIRDPLQDSFFGYRYGGIYLRGYPEGAFYGSVYALGSVEARFPIWGIERGVSTLPIFVRQLHGAVFVDAGGASPDSLGLDLLHFGVGGELRLDLVLAYHMGLTLRLGYGRGLSEKGTNNVFLNIGWGF